MKKISLLLVLCLLLVNGITQSKFPIEKFGFNSELQNLELKTNVGFFVKGNKYNVQSLCETYTGKYISSIKGWHYIRLSPSNIIELSLAASQPAVGQCRTRHYRQIAVR